MKQWRYTHGEATYPTFLKFTEFIREAAEKANIPELEGMPALNSPRVNKTPKKKLEESSSLQYCAKVMQMIINEYREYCDISAIFNEILP